MKQRCSNPRHPRYALYGGRRIKVYDQWVDNFIEFINHIGPRPSMEHSVDRIDPDKNYEPNNVRWATMQIQNNNKRK